MSGYTWYECKNKQNIFIDCNNQSILRLRTPLIRSLIITKIWIPTFISALDGGTTLWSSTLISPAGIWLRHCSIMCKLCLISSILHKYLMDKQWEDIRELFSKIFKRKYCSCVLSEIVDQWVGNSKLQIFINYCMDEKCLLQKHPWLSVILPNFLFSSYHHQQLIYCDI